MGKGPGKGAGAAMGKGPGKGAGAERGRGKGPGKGPGLRCAILCKVYLKLVKHHGTMSKLARRVEGRSFLHEVARHQLLTSIDST